MSDLKGDDYERAFYRDWNAGKVIDGNGKRVVPQREVQETIAKWIKANTEHREWYICPKCSHQTPRFKDEWVGLTIEERTDIRRRIQEYTPMDDIKYGEAVQFFTEEALKEKNT